MSDRYKVKTPVCYLDMDGVTTNFHHSACKVHGRDPYAIMKTWPRGEYGFEKVFGITTEELWAKCRGYEFWRNMPILPGALWLYESLSTKYQVIFTSMATGDGYCAQAKVDWLQEYFGKQVQYAILHCSKGYMNPKGALMIDDYEKNIEAFTVIGGASILYPQVWNTQHAIADSSDWKEVTGMVIQAAMKALPGLSGQ